MSVVQLLEKENKNLKEKKKRIITFTFAITWIPNISFITYNLIN